MPGSSASPGTWSAAATTLLAGLLISVVPFLSGEALAGDVLDVYTRGVGRHAESNLVATVGIGVRAVSDEALFSDLKTLSGGVLEVNADLKLPETKDILAKNRSSKKKGGGKKKQQS